VKLDALMVDAFIARENVARTVVAGETPVAPSVGAREMTVGGLFASSWIPGAGVSGSACMSARMFVVACWIT
jgi:hypothetical protein